MKRSKNETDLNFWSNFEFGAFGENEAEPNAARQSIMEPHKEGKKRRDEIRSKTSPEVVLGQDFEMKVKIDDRVNELNEKNRVHFFKKTPKIKFCSATVGDLPL